MSSAGLKVEDDESSTLAVLGGIIWNSCKLAPRLAIKAIRELVSLVPSHALGFICLQEVQSWGKQAGHKVRLAMQTDANVEGISRCFSLDYLIGLGLRNCGG